jgi:hypothetical protein
MTVEEAVENLRLCTEEFEDVDYICKRWTQMCGFAVWREGHALDRQKLRRRRRAKLDLKCARWYLDYALANAPYIGGC